ncbi:MAG: hypothetical protein IKK87_07640 [Bacteroidaceae bacterium]|nr:hypothetical protein [Bacteroidaceae bacterium]
MKTVKFYATMMAVALCATILTSCSPDEDITPEETLYQGRVTVYNQVRFLQNNIVEVDSLGNFVQRVNGAPLNPADTTELYIGVANLSDAAEMFQGWLSPDTEVNLSAPSTIDMETGLKDENGQLQETVYFKVVDEAPTLAEVTFAKGTVMKHVSKIIFIKESAWPENDESKYLIGDKTWGRAVCIREAKKGVSGLLLYISRFTTDQTKDTYASMSLAKEASKILRADWDMYVSFFEDAGAGKLTKNTFYYTNESTFLLFVTKHYAIDLSAEDKTDWWDIDWCRKSLHWIEIETF